MATSSQRGWNGTHVPTPAQYRCGEMDETGRIARIESTVELTGPEVKAIDESIRKYGARYAIVRPAPKDPAHLDVEYRTARPFERIRRITGYLTGSLETWNSAKRAEEQDRVKHGVNTEETK